MKGGKDLLDGSILEDGLLDGMMVDGSFGASTIFKLPRVLPLVVQQFWVVVTLV